MAVALRVRAACHHDNRDIGELFMHNSCRVLQGSIICIAKTFFKYLRFRQRALCARSNISASATDT